MEGAIVHRTTRDVGGNVLKEEILSGDNTASNLISQSTYDLLGRTLRRTDARGIGTAHEYLDAGRTNVTRQIHLAANGAVTTNATEATVRHRDGRTQLVLRNGAPVTTFAYAVDTEGLPSGWCRLRTTVYEGPLGAASPVWSRTTSDFLGRTLREERPGFSVDSVPSVVQTSHVYEPGTGRLLSTTQRTVVASVPSVLSVVLYSYDSLGERFRTTQDLDLDGIVDLAGPDRVTDTHTGYWFGDAGVPSRSLGEGWHRESRQYVYPSDATPKLVSTQRQRLTGLGNAVAGGILVAESQSLDLLSNTNVSRTVLDRANRRVVQSSDGPASTLDALSVAVNGLTLTNVTATGVTTTHAYDPLGRRVASSQLVPNPVNPDNPVQRTASMVSYDPYGRVAWTADAAGTTNRFAYDPSPAAAPPSPTPWAKPPTPPTTPKAA